MLHKFKPKLESGKNAEPSWLTPNKFVIPRIHVPEKLSAIAYAVRGQRNCFQACVQVAAGGVKWPTFLHQVIHHLSWKVELNKNQVDYQWITSFFPDNMFKTSSLQLHMQVAATEKASKPMQKLHQGEIFLCKGKIKISNKIRKWEKRWTKLINPE